MKISVVCLTLALIFFYIVLGDKRSLGVLLGGGFIYVNAVINSLILFFVVKKFIAYPIFAIASKFIFMLATLWIMFSVLNKEYMIWFISGVCFAILTLVLFVKKTKLDHKLDHKLGH